MLKLTTKRQISNVKPRTKADNRFEVDCYSFRQTIAKPVLCAGGKLLSFSNQLRKPLN
jgi:hypothetical protein